jgi:hypothetical protein
MKQVPMKQVPMKQELVRRSPQRVRLDSRRCRRPPLELEQLAQLVRQKLEQTWLEPQRQLLEWR